MTGRSRWFSDIQKISTHTLTWSVTCTQFGVDKCPKYFNSHAHVERDVKSKFSGICTLDFNSHAHVERDPPALRISWRRSISTHTLTWSVTLICTHLCIVFGISTHTLTWSVTAAVISVGAFSAFQLTRSRGA